MNIIKFRAWDKKLKKWSDVAKDTKIKDINRLKDYVWCQFTGKYDIHKKEIHEGDIVRFERPFDHKSFVGEISYVDSHGAYFVIHSGISDNQLYAFCHYEVIGNIFETPEILETD